MTKTRFFENDDEEQIQISDTILAGFCSCIWSGNKYNIVSINNHPQVTVTALSYHKIDRNSVMITKFKHKRFQQKYDLLKAIVIKGFQFQSDKRLHGRKVLTGASEGSQNSRQALVGDKSINLMVTPTQGMTLSNTSLSKPIFY